MTTVNPSARDAVGEYKWGFHDDEKPLFIAEKGLNEEVIRGMSAMKGEPAWMLENRLDAYQQFLKMKNPSWAGSPDVLNAIDLPSVTARGYAFQIELTYRAAKRGFKIVEVPIIFRDRVAGESKMSWRITAEAAWLVPAMRLRN